ncbi:MAG: hypothetical protein GF350_09535 [Chitinivibrionales bacterium]|nr:hypothetical protein [Chitinivibrionales bacterium]
MHFKRRSDMKRSFQFCVCALCLFASIGYTWTFTTGAERHNGRLEAILEEEPIFFPPDPADESWWETNAPSIEEFSDGTLIAAWNAGIYGRGSEEGTGDWSAWYSVKPPNGSWSEGKHVVNSKSTSPSGAVWNPWLYRPRLDPDFGGDDIVTGYTKGVLWSTGSGYLKVSRDGGATWSDPIAMPSSSNPLNEPCFRGSAKNRPLEIMRNGVCVDVIAARNSMALALSDTSGGVY